MIKAFITTCLVIVTWYCSAQVVEEPKPKLVHIQEVAVVTGFSFSQSATLQMSEFQKLMPNSVLLNQNMAGYQDSYFGFWDVDRVFGVMLGMQIRDKAGLGYKKNATVRLGFQYSTGVFFAANKYRVTQTTIDTLVAQQSGELYFVDSVNTRSYSASYGSNQLRLDIAALYSTNREARWSLYGGIGINAGFSLYAQTYVSYRESTNEKINIGYYEINNRGQNLDNVDESIRNKMNTVFSGYVPLGIDFRIGKHRPFWKQVHLTHELNPTLRITYIPELGTYPEALLFQQFGIKVRW